VPGTKIAESVRREQIMRAAFAIAAETGLRSITIRDVALRAETSPGLVLFHFGSKDALILELAKWLLATTTALEVGPKIVAIEDPLDRLIALLRQEMARLSAEPLRIRVFFEFWSVGLGDRKIGALMQRELDRYREAFRPMAEAVLAAEPTRFAGVGASALTAVAVSFIKGCAVQSMIEPQLDIAGFLRAAEELIAPGRVSSVQAVTRRSRAAASSRAR
jgi:TetR/AcrR family transcriptional regulator, transcriptional repressor of bet genes